MNILALDTSNEYCSIALLMGEKLIEREALAGQSHSEMALAMTAEILAEAGISLADLDGIAFGSGPGSFTGLRIACGVAQGLALGAGLKVLGIGTLDALAAGASSKRVIACLDARMGEIYHAAFESINGELHCVSEPELCFPEDAPPLQGEWTGCGSGFLAYREALASRYAGQIERIVERRPHAGEIARLAVSEFDKGRGLDPEMAAPLYVRNKVALKESER
ncbi:MAG TPA: tRNA (adenosine(37)-N6)-threonylcarbamoyltransferase complex dimerization subunit type 1 TsaB [Burkholderiales bacterium]|nr:tRNA (adenosine(37)-N6)-threonylcarbamoyltransferase complex dimerization subunit type 1 TsaB [Burkholderiales bacterium]